MVFPGHIMLCRDSATVDVRVYFERQRVFVLLSFLFKYSPLLFWIHRGTLHNPVVPQRLQKEDIIFRRRWNSKVWSFHQVDNAA